MNYKPSMYYHDIYEINYELIKEKNIKFLLFDIDNTIMRTKDKIPSQELIDLINKLKKDFHVIILSNALPHRVKKVTDALNIDGYSFSMKPSKNNYLKILKKYNITSESIAAIGDQLYTDIKGANNLNITSILVDRISKREFITTKINRIRERRLINKKKIITRGEYYE